MKPLSARYVLVTLGLVVILAQSLFAEELQTKLTEVASVPFGASQQQTIQIFNAWSLSKGLKMNVPLALQKGNEFTVTGGQFAGVDVIGWFFEFARNKLYFVSIMFQPKDALGTLDRVASLLTKKYGPATTSARKYSFPYNIPFRNLDEATINEAFKTNKAEFYSSWKLSNGTIYLDSSFVEGSGVVTTLKYEHTEFSKGAETDAKSDL